VAAGEMIVVRPPRTGAGSYSRSPFDCFVNASVFPTHRPDVGTCALTRPISSGCPPSGCVPSVRGRYSNRLAWARESCKSQCSSHRRASSAARSGREWTGACEEPTVRPDAARIVHLGVHRLDISHRVAETQQPCRRLSEGTASSFSPCWSQRFPSYKANSEVRPPENDRPPETPIAVSAIVGPRNTRTIKWPQIRVKRAVLVVAVNAAVEVPSSTLRLDGELAPVPRAACGGGLARMARTPPRSRSEWERLAQGTRTRP